MSFSHLYIEFNHRPLQAPDVRIWAQWMLTADRTVAKTRLRQRRIMVSTVFTGVAQSDAADPPMLYETRVFAPQGSSWAEHHEAYPTRSAALAGHARIVEAITTSWELDLTREQMSLAEWNTAVDALLDDMQRHGVMDTPSRRS